MRLTALLCLLPAIAAAQDDPIVRVKVLGGPRTAVVSADEGPLMLHADRSSEPLTVLVPGEQATVERAGGQLRVRTSSGDWEAAVVEAVPGRDERLSVRAGNARRSYYGALSIEADGGALRLVNYVPLEHYVASVVAGEYPFEEPEGVKAQAVLARTYALKNAGRHASHDLSDDTGSQVYRGAGQETATSRAAAEATRGEVLTYAGALAEAVYYSSSGGHTADNESVWNGAPIAYLRGRPDPYDSEAPDHHWTTRASSSRLLAALSRRYGGTVTGIEVADRGGDGRVRQVRLHGARQATVRGSDFRSAVNAVFGSRTLRSTHFEVYPSGGDFVFEGRGWGHGVGMSQYGARGMAREGHSYREILDFYFAGTSLDYHDAIRPADPAAPREPALVTSGTTRRPRTRAERLADARAEMEAASRIPVEAPPVRLAASDERERASTRPPRRVAW
ncbi:MAG TPA: SpoIID/LytB domain-containing protein [Rubricoccaceae bacterium]|nr:SpoIID/LytB domain-containing protein [Rubricoccaceae bacterium]